MTLSTTRQQAAVNWFRSLRDQICTVFETIEDELCDTIHAHLPAGRFERQIWQREAVTDTTPKITDTQIPHQEEGGGGEMSLLHGRVFEKVGVNISTVHGHFSQDFREQIPGAGDSGAFWASGISLVAHMRSPHVPAVHMNTRYIVTSKAWFGGGTDLTPMFFNSSEAIEDKKIFHMALRHTCDQYDASYYDKFSAWCDSYFYLKHRSEQRGVGGIFFDYLDNDWGKDFSFTQDVGRTFLDVYPRIVRARMAQKWTTEEREQQLIRRGRYVEFNLLYDRGTMFGLKTGGNVDAILMSLPPEVKWP